MRRLLVLLLALLAARPALGITLPCAAPIPADWSMADAGANTAVAGTGGSTTVGVSFVAELATTVTGCRFYWLGATLGAKTVRCRLYHGGVSQRTIDVSAPATNGVVSGTFTSSYAITGTELNTTFTISMWDTSGANYVDLFTAYHGPVATGGTNSFVARPGIAYTNISLYASGDANPTSTAGSERYPIDPTF